MVANRESELKKSFMQGSSGEFKSLRNNPGRDMKCIPR